MARVTVEDCLEHVNNRFELVTLATKRARQLSLLSADPLVARENDKNTVIALREIADGLISSEILDKDDEDEFQFHLKQHRSRSGLGDEAPPRDT